MTPLPNVGILGIAMHLPAEVRRNDWWPAEVVSRWSSRSVLAAPEVSFPADDQVAAEMRALLMDPFQGSVQRHVLASDEPLLDLELAAARAAIERAGIDLGEIDLVLTDSLAQPVLATNTACCLHYGLGLRNDCFTLRTDGAQHAFLLQLSIAKAMIAAGQARCALLVQSTAASRILNYDEPLSVVFGDGATAAVVGPVADDFGLLAASHRTYGAQAHTLIASVPGGAWYDAGRAYLHVTNPAAAWDIHYRAVERSNEVISSALAGAGVRPDDVVVFAMHQGVPWMQRLVQARAGLHAARSTDTFAQTGHLFGASAPSVLVAAEANDVLRSGDLVVCMSGGNGMTYGAAVVRWGRT